MDSGHPIQLVGMALVRGLVDESALRNALLADQDLLEALQTQGSLDAEDLEDLAGLVKTQGQSGVVEHEIPDQTCVIESDQVTHPSTRVQDPWAALPFQDEERDDTGRHVLRSLTLSSWKHYRDLRFVAEGGMGRVFKAFDPTLKRVVALKFLRRDDPEMIERFQLEAQNQAKVEHPNICKVFEVGQWHGQSYIAMQFIEGETLEVAALNLDLPQKAKVMEEVAEAIHAAHHNGLIHRDLKPANIMVEITRSGPKATILDFGLAKGLEATGMTVQGVVIGTTHYMAPEQASGDHARVGRRTDVYGLGATLHRVLTGHAPFAKTDGLDTLRRTLEEDLPSLRRLVPDLPEDLDTIVRKCMEKNPAARYESALALAEDLRRWREGEPLLARRVSMADKLWRRFQRNRALSIGIAATTLLVLGLLAWNTRTRILGRRQVEVAQRFGMEVKELESLLRIERMMPAHDMRPVEGQVRVRLEALRQSMASLGPTAEGPGQYAIGRGCLAMRDYGKALGALERAWALGYRPPEVAEALAQVHLAMGDRERSNASTDAWRRHRDLALKFFRLTEVHGLESATLAKAQVAFL